ncbi:hypothetical protein [Amycolatopsis antarctica]|uniref:hypothetical protein n=1 Tax=Amycolatopsis antarctica TaxID=1854586 RepID=UPI0010554688|nr:hypothetical protein [Amycolatopsis antarctica]
MATTRRQLAGRWCTRALVVVGGAVAGTAAAWILSAAAASADTDVTPVTDAAVAGVHDITGGVSELLDGVPRLSQPIDTHPVDTQPVDPPRPDDGAGEGAGGQQAGRAPHHVVLDFADQAVVRPVARTLGAVEHVLNRPEDAPRVIEEALPTPEQVVAPILELLDPRSYGKPGELPKLPGLPGLDGERDDQPSGGSAADAPGAMTAQPPAAGLPAAAPLPELLPLTTGPETHRVVPPVAVDSADVPRADVPPVDNGVDPSAPIRAPIAPPAAPAGPGGGVGGVHSDGLPSGIASGVPALRDANTAGSLRPRDRFRPVEPGSQPGVTPD